MLSLTSACFTIKKLDNVFIEYSLSWRLPSTVWYNRLGLYSASFIALVSLLNDTRSLLLRSVRACLTVIVLQLSRAESLKEDLSSNYVNRTEGVVFVAFVHCRMYAGDSRLLTCQSRSGCDILFQTLPIAVQKTTFQQK